MTRKRPMVSPRPSSHPLPRGPGRSGTEALRPPWLVAEQEATLQGLKGPTLQSYLEGGFLLLFPRDLGLRVEMQAVSHWPRAGAVPRPMAGRLQTAGAGVETGDLPEQDQRPALSLLGVARETVLYAAEARTLSGDLFSEDEPWVQGSGDTAGRCKASWDTLGSRLDATHQQPTAGPRQKLGRRDSGAEQ